MSDHKDCFIEANRIRELNTDESSTIQFIRADGEVVFAMPKEHLEYEEVEGD